MNIIPASPEHASAIAQAVMMGIGDEICTDFAQPHHTLDDVRHLFATLAGLPDSQYSYNNTLVATDDNGNVAGVCVAYDGARLHQLRERFFEYAKTILDRDMHGMPDETDPEEYYLDSLAVMPEHRGKGIGTALIKAMAEKAKTETEKPLGLLVDKTNPKAEKLYLSLGFKYVGDRPFANTLMSHLQM